MTISLDAIANAARDAYARAGISERCARYDTDTWELACVALASGEHLPPTDILGAVVIASDDDEYRRAAAACAEYVALRQEEGRIKRRLAELLPSYPTRVRDHMRDGHAEASVHAAYGAADRARRAMQRKSD